MMDYPTWRKKAPTPQFITFSNAYRLEQLVNDERTATATTTSVATTATGTSSPSTPTTAINSATSAALPLLQQHQQHAQPQQSIPVADNIATIIGVSACGGSTAISSSNNAISIKQTVKLFLSKFFKS